MICLTLLKRPFGFNNVKSGGTTQPPVIDLSGKHSLRTWKIIIDRCLKRAYKLNKNTNKELIIIFENHTKDLQVRMILIVLGLL